MITIWLQAYSAASEIKNKTDIKRVFIYNFSHDAEEAFQEKYEVY